MSNVSWGWRKLLQIRNIIRPHVRYKIGNGSAASVWFDSWDDLCPLMNYLTHRAISNAGYDKSETVSDVIIDGAWAWPSAWYNDFPVLNQINVPYLNHDQADTLQWKHHDGTLSSFAVKYAWHSVRVRGDEVDWCHIVWSKYVIPRHATHLWLVMRRRLLTQDRMRQWNIGNDVDLSLLRCPLCKMQQDSHDHLFFECGYSSQVWNRVLSRSDMSFGSSRWSDIVAWLLPMARRNSTTTIVARLIVAASAYFIWQERNNRIHGKGERVPDDMAKVILDVVRLKLTTIRFKKNTRVDQMRRTWSIASVITDEG